MIRSARSPHTFGRWAVASNFVTHLKNMAPMHSLKRCIGVFLLLASASCGDAPLIGEKKDRTLELATDTIQLPSGVDLHDVEVRTKDQGKDFEPAQIAAIPGDYLRFTIGDSRTHAIVFEVTAPEGRAFLEKTGQLRSPPLVTNGAVWVITLKDAPHGTYGFRCLIHHDTGQVTVAASRPR
jgi:plastocyanin